MQSRVIGFPDYDIEIPFVCHRCGNCCRNYFPSVDIGSLPEIARILNSPIHEIQDGLSEDCAAHNAGKPSDCRFLAPEGNRCLIHEVRPDGCRWFPSFGKAGLDNVDCPGYREFIAVFNEFCRTRKSAGAGRAGSPGKAGRIPGPEWQNMLNRLATMQVSERFVRRFVLQNGKQMPGSFPAGRAEEGQ
jgi:Fe-S-cluster containining protein